MQFVDIIYLLRILNISVINNLVIKIMSCITEKIAAATATAKTLANHPAGSICCGNCCYDYTMVLWNILFLFHCATNFQLTMVDKDAMAAQHKKTVECGGSTLANATRWLPLPPEPKPRFLKMPFCLSPALCFRFCVHVAGFILTFLFFQLIILLPPHMQNQQQHIVNSSFGPLIRF